MLISHGNFDHEARNLHLGHAHVSGLTDYYLLTGDKRSREVINEISQWWLFMAKNYYPTPRPANPDPNTRAWAEAERDFGWPLYTMNELVRVTGDPELHRKAAGQLVRHLLDWWKTPMKHEINGQQLGINDAAKGTGWWTMDEMDNGDGNGTNPWMAGSLFSALIQFYQHEQIMPSGVNQAELKDMMWQCMNYVVKNGWYEKGQFFSYSEARKDEDGGAEHLLYSLAYLYQLLEQDKKAGLVANPQWYDTSDKWLQISSKEFKRYTSGYIGGEQAYGFYGYEMVFPVDYFNVMTELKEGAPSFSLEPPAQTRIYSH